jgi:hypothetical protein
MCFPGRGCPRVTDVDLDRAKSVASGLPGGVQVHATGQDVIGDDGVDAVVVASWGPTHEEYVLASIEAGKQVFCEKPLATTREACERIVDAEVATGRRLVMVGFMRRYDAGYRAMKDTVTSGEIGAPLLFHSAHRNPSVPRVSPARWWSSTPACTTSTYPASSWTTRSPPCRSSSPDAAAWPPHTFRTRWWYCSRWVAACWLTWKRRSTSRTGTTSAARWSVRAEPLTWRRAAPSWSSARVGTAGTRRLARAVHPRLRHRAAGVDQRGGVRQLHRSELVGRLRRHSGLRRRCGGAAERRPGGGVAARTTRPLPVRNRRNPRRRLNQHRLGERDG